jgi:uncharacterized protein YndB with AHSA1/START domain
MRQPKGTFVADGEHATLTFRRTYRHSIEHVWEAISTPEGLRGWLMCTTANIEPRTGGRIELVSGPAQFHSTGTIRVWDPPRVLEYEWNVEPVATMPKGEHAIFRYELAADGDATQLVVTYTRITLSTARGFLPGLHVLLERLEAQVDGTAMPAFQPRFDELRAEYPEWSHAPAAGQ